MTSLGQLRFSCRDRDDLLSAFCFVRIDLMADPGRPHSHIESQGRGKIISEDPLQDETPGEQAPSLVHAVPEAPISACERTVVVGA